MTPFTQQTLQQFLDELASGNPVPGGGAVSALSGALAASLLMMVCRLTIGKKGYETVETEMRDALTRLEPLRAELIALMQEDSDAYARVMEAYKLPKTTDSEKAARAAAIQAALKRATAAPVQVAELTHQVASIAHAVVAKGNQNAASDARVGMLLAHAGLRGAAMNVRINLGAVKDEIFVNTRRARMDELSRQGGGETNDSGP